MICCDRVSDIESKRFVSSRRLTEKPSGQLANIAVKADVDKQVYVQFGIGSEIGMHEG